MSRHQLYARVGDLRAEGLSYTDIGDRLGLRKSQVAGIINRHIGRAPKAAAVLKPPAKPQRVHRKRPQKVPERVVVLPPPPPEPLPTTCQYALSDGRPWLWCDAPRRAGSVYCAAHHAICYIRRAA